MDCALRSREVDANRKALSMSLWMILVLAPGQLVVGDFHGLNTLEHQPVKVAAMEGHWETDTGVPLLLFAWPDQKNQTNHRSEEHTSELQSRGHLVCRLLL